jgi:ribosome biogenesis GTPase
MRLHVQNGCYVAKEKGKSRKRIRDWEQRYRAGEEIEDVAGRRGKLTRRAVKLGPGSFAGSEENLEDLPTGEGMVAAVFRRGASVRLGTEPIFCGIAKTFRAPESTTPLVVGDNVTVALSRPKHTDGHLEIDKNRMDGMILSRGPRETVLARFLPRSRKRRDKYGTEAFEKVIVANMNVLLIVASTSQPPLRPRLIERYLIVAERGELGPLLVINKIDLAQPEAQALSDFSALELEIHLTSAVTGEGMEKLESALRGKRSVLVGASGVGKSTLINRLIPGADAPTRTVRSKDERGRHTTAGAGVYDLPGGGIIVDTPGVRELGLHMDAAELPWYFPEFENLAPNCKFNNCTHTHEPDCAVITAVQAGKIPSRRYESYLHLLDTLDEDMK